MRKRNLFRWALQGKPYLLLVLPSFVILFAIIGVLL